MALSEMLQIGKAGEHIVCATLIMQGFNAFLADQGLPYDVIVDTINGLKKIQVKTTTKLISYPKSQEVYRFSMRSGNHKNSGRLYKADVDYVACVTLDKIRVGFVNIKELTRNDGNIKCALDLRTKDIEYKGRIYSNGTIRGRYGRFIEDYKEFKP